MTHNTIIAQKIILQNNKTLENQIINKGLSTRYGAVLEPKYGVFESYLVYIPGNANENINFS